MYADLILYNNPKRPFINPKLDLFAWLDTDHLPTLFPAHVVDTVQLMLPEKCRRMDVFPKDTWEFLTWQVEERGYCVVRTIDSSWWYWAILADKWSLLDMVKVLL